MYVKHDDNCILLNSSKSSKPKIHEINVQKIVPIQQPLSGVEYSVDISAQALLPNDVIVIPESLRNMRLVCSGMSGEATASIKRVTLSNYSTPFNNKYNVSGGFVFDRNLHDGKLTMLYGNIKYFRLSELLQ